MVRTNGFTEFNFQGEKFKPKKDYSDDVARRRLKNLVLPISEMAGLKLVRESEKTPIYCDHLLKSIHQCWREFSGFWKFPYERKHDHITVTIRDSWRNKHRNSDRKAWDKFISWAENNGETVKVLEDKEENPISVKDRWDLYQCKMNMMVNGGPALLLMLSEAPYILAKYPGNAHDVFLLSVYHWIWKNSQLPWATKHQRILWKQDTFENLQKAYAASGVH